VAEAQVRIKIADSERGVVAEVSVDNVVVRVEAESLRKLREKVLSKKFAAEAAKKYFHEKRPKEVDEYLRLITLKDEITEAYAEAEKAYLRSKTLLTEEFTIPSEARVFLAKTLYVAYDYITQIWQGGRLLKVNGGTETFDMLARKQVGLAVSAGGEARSTSYRDFLESYGLNPDEAFALALERVPTLWLYVTDDKRLIITDSFFKLGEVEGYLYKASADEIREIIEKLSQTDRERILSILGKTFGLKEGENYDTLSEITFFLRKSLSNEIVDYYMAQDRWHNILEKAKPKDGADPFIYEFYSSYALPYFRPFDSPHALLFTPTRRGKTTLARAVQGDEPVAHATATSLIGGIDPSTKRPTIGALHGRDIVLQVESLEVNVADETLRYTLDYMALGFSRREVGLHRIVCYGTAPLVFTGNTLSGKVEQFSNSVRLLLSNPEALGSRTIFFYLPYLREANPVAFNNEFFKAWKIIRGVRSNARLKKLLRKIWEQPSVENWLKEKVEFPSKVNDKIEEVEDKGLGFLSTYLRNVFMHSSRRIKALALNNVLLAKLPEVWSGTLSISELLDEAAESKHEMFKEKMVASLGYLVGDLRFATKAELLATLPYYARVTIYAIARWYNEHLEAIQGPVEVPLSNEDVRRYIAEAIDTRKWSTPKILSMLRKKILIISENKLLNELLAFTLKGNDIVAKIPKDSKLTALSPSELEELLELKPREKS